MKAVALALVALACSALVGCGFDDASVSGPASVAPTPLPTPAADAGAPTDVARARDDAGPETSPGPGADAGAPETAAPAADAGGGADVGLPTATDDAGPETAAPVADAGAADAGPIASGPIPECPVNTARLVVCGLGATRGTCHNAFTAPQIPVSGCFIRDDVDYHFVCVQACP